MSTPGPNQHERAMPEAHGNGEGSDSDVAVDLGPLAAMLHHALRRAHADATDALHAALADENMRPLPFALLVVLRRNPGLRQAQLGFALDIQPTNLVPLLDGLAVRGLAERRPVPGDRRARGVFLTRLGAETVARLEAKAAAHEAGLAARLGTEGRLQLIALLKRLSDSGLDED